MIITSDRPLRFIRPITSTRRTHQPSTSPRPDPAQSAKTAAEATTTSRLQASPSRSVATLSTLDPFSVRVVPGQGVLNFSPVPANGQATSSNTFTVIVDPSIPLDFSKLQWTFLTNTAPPVANPGPNQTVKVGSTVTLDGADR